MVSPDKLKKTKEAESASLSRNRSSRKKRKPSTVLKSKKFVLCFKNLTLQTKCENQIKNLGAIIVPYIDKEVHYVITDFPGYNGKATSLAETTSIISPQCYSVSPATSVSGDDPTAVKKSRTRTEAMLEKVSVQTQSVSSIKNPITSALSWKIPVYSLDYFQSILKKKLSQLQLINEAEDASRNDRSVRVFRKRYLKLEHVVEHKYRPEFKEPSRWPSIDANSAAGSCPFDTRRSTRKHGQKKDSDRMNRTCNKTANEAGYCEICAIHYDDLSQHVMTSAHLKIVCDDKHFVDLDNCIKTRSVEAFLASHNLNDNNLRMKELNTNEDMGRNLRKSVSLHLNNNNENSSVTRSLSNSKLLTDESLKQPLQVQCNGFTNYHLRKSTAKSDSVLMKSPTVKDLLRETRKMYASCPEGNRTPYNNHKELSQLSPIEETDGPHRLRSRKNLLLPATLIGTTAEDTNKNRNQLLSPLTPTSNHFLRSSSSPKLLPGTRNASKAVHGEDDKKSPPTFIKQNSIGGLHNTRRVNKVNCVSPCENDTTKRISRSSTSPREEARMNGKPSSLKRKCSASASDDEVVSPRNNVPSYQCNRNHLYNDSTTEQNGNVRKRMSLEEKFLEDNKEYYKVEMLRTKLRSTEYYCNKKIDQSVASTTKKEESKPEKNNRRQILQQQQQQSQSQQYAAVDSDEQKKMGARSRQSALHLLNLEATNFLFGPPKKEDSSDDSTNDESTGDVKTERESSPPKSISKISEKSKVSSPNNVNSKRISRTKEKRRTHAEVFIHDNLDYYKFEISGSRLRDPKTKGSGSSHKRSQSKAMEVASTSTIPSEEALPEVKSEIVEVKQEIVEVKEEYIDEPFVESKIEEPVVVRKRGRTKKNVSSPLPADDITFVDSEGSQLDDIKIEMDTDILDDGSYERPVPPSDSVRFAFEAVPNYEAWYKAFRRFDLCDEQYIQVPHSVYFTQYRHVTPLPYARRRDPDKCSGGLAVASPSSKDNGILAHFRRRRRPRLGRFVIDDKPRKSPRCHASTLAILSSLTGNRRRSRKLLASLELTAVKSSIGPRQSLNKTDLENNKSFLAEITQEYQKKLKEAVQAVAKDIDDHFIDVFKSDDCEDAYLKKISKTIAENGAKLENGDVEGESSQCCLHIDDEILRDEDLLRSLMSEHPDTFDNMSSFLASSEGCTSMETAQDEELMVPRSNDMLARLCRENDLSCNSSDCGASSTCEFLGFAEDGRTVSRKRKRKRPNMTGWPDERNKRRQLRILRARQNGCADNGEPKNEESNPPAATEVVDNKASEPSSINASEPVSEADSESTDDDIPLQELAGVRKRRRTNNSLSAANDALEMSRKYEEVVMNGEREPPLSRRTSKAATTPARKVTPVTRRKSSASQTSRRNRCI